MRTHKLLTASIILGLAGSISAGLAADVSWTGGANTFMWSDAQNWSSGVKPNTYDTAVYINQTTSLATEYGLRLDTSHGVQSLNVNIARFSLIATNSKTLRVAAGGAITFGSNYTNRGPSTFTSTNASYRIYLNAAGDLLLRNDGTGEVTFNAASLQNDNSSTATQTINAQGRGDWTFLANSYLGRQMKSNGSEFDVAAEVNLHLQGGTNAFTGVFTYGATRAAELGNLTVDSGTFMLSNSTVNLSNGASINQGGTLTGYGKLNGNVTVGGQLAARDGTLETANLALEGTARFLAQLGHTSTESKIKALGSITINSGADLVLSLATGAPAIHEGDLFFLLINGGQGAVTGIFTKLNGVSTDLSEGATFEWNSQLWQITYNGSSIGNSFTGGHDIALQAIPEPGSLAFIVAGIGAFALLRRKN